MLNHVLKMISCAAIVASFTPVSAMLSNQLANQLPSEKIEKNERIVNKNTSLDSYLQNSDAPYLLIVGLREELNQTAYDECKGENQYVVLVEMDSQKPKSIIKEAIFVDNVVVLGKKGVYDNKSDVLNLSELPDNAFATVEVRLSLTRIDIEDVKQLNTHIDRILMPRAKLIWCGLELKDRKNTGSVVVSKNEKEASLQLKTVNEETFKNDSSVNPSGNTQSKKGDELEFNKDEDEKPVTCFDLGVNLLSVRRQKALGYEDAKSEPFALSFGKLLLHPFDYAYSYFFGNKSNAKK